jgi:glutathione S-transferase
MLLRVNPRGEVPALVDEGVVLCDSKVICAYLEGAPPRARARPARPRAARALPLPRAQVRQRDRRVRVRARDRQAHAPRARAAGSRALARCAEALARHYESLERELGGREWFLGEFSLVDIALTPTCARPRSWVIRPARSVPRSTAWLARGARAPSLKRAMRELAQGFAASQQPDSLFDASRLHWRSDRIEFALRVGSRRVARRRARRGRAFLSPIPVKSST